MLSWIKSAFDDIKYNTVTVLTIRRCFVKANCFTVNSIFNSNQYICIDQFAPILNQIVNDSVKMLQEIELNDYFLTFLDLDDANIEQVAKHLIEMNVLNAIVMLMLM